MHPIEQILETALYVDDLARAETFYRELFGFPVMGKETGRHVFFRVGNSVLLLFNAAQTALGGNLPAHGSSGPGHAAFAIRQDALDEWRQRLAAHGIAVEKEVPWPRGGRSLYFRDPAGNALELVTPGCWGLPSGW